MDHTNVIIRPLVTEKSTHQQNTLNSYAFEVNRGANKAQIREAVEKLYNVKVNDVRTLNRKGKPRRSRYRMTRTNNWKRAVVVLAEDNRIDLF
jgi:large subunit ribosomal protein L23